MKVIVQRQDSAANDLDDFREEQIKATTAQNARIQSIVEQQEAAAQGIKLATLASLELQSLKVTWTFPTPPPWASHLSALGLAFEIYLGRCLLVG